MELMVLSDSALRAAEGLRAARIHLRALDTPIGAEMYAKASEALLFVLAKEMRYVQAYEVCDLVEGDSTLSIASAIARLNNRVWYTADGMAVSEGMRVFTSECEWGTVREVAEYIEAGNAWHRVEMDSGRCASFDESRLAAHNHVSNRPDPKRI